MIFSDSSPSAWQSVLQSFLESSPAKPLIAIVGPTCSGKTSFSLLVAKKLRSEGLHPEIVNADSRQFYTYLDIGTAKISFGDMDGVPHHLLSVLDPKEDCSIFWFQEKAKEIISAIHERGHTPLLVGGSMLYVSALIDGYEPVLSSDPSMRERLSREYDTDDGVTLHQKLQDVDPESAARIPRQNKVYVMRALEIYEITGKPKSEKQKNGSSDYDVLMFGMDIPMEQLEKRILDRTRTMLSGGWIEEVKLLRELGYDANDPAMESLGYREIIAALDRNDLDVEKLASDISRKIRRYAKRSNTWWKRESRIHWVKLA